MFPSGGLDLARNIMIDIESLDTKPGAIILAIGACTLDLKQEFLTLIDPAQSRMEGFTESSATMRWWNSKPAALRGFVFGGDQKPLSAINALSDWLFAIRRQNNMQDIWVWAKGTHFDISLLEAYYRHFDVGYPWEYGNVRDYRTLAARLPHVPYVRPTDAHNPLADAIAQAKHLVSIDQVL